MGVSCLLILYFIQRQQIFNYVKIMITRIFFWSLDRHWKEAIICRREAHICWAQKIKFYLLNEIKYIKNVLITTDRLLLQVTFPLYKTDRPFHSIGFYQGLFQSEFVTPFISCFHGQTPNTPGDRFWAKVSGTSIGE